LYVFSYVLTYEEFIRRKKDFYRERNLEDSTDKQIEIMKSRYENLIKELEFAMKPPLNHLPRILW